MSRFCVATSCLLVCLVSSGFAESPAGPVPEGRESRGGREIGVGAPAQRADRFAYPVTKPDFVANQRHHLITALKDLQDDYVRAGMLDEALLVRKQIRVLEKHDAVVLPVIPEVVPSTPGVPSPTFPIPAGAAPGAPPTGSTVNDVPPAFGTTVRRTFYLPVVGSTAGIVWGDGPYTSDSDLATAAVHAGVLKEGQAAVLKVTIVPGKPSYQSSTSHGVTTHSWSSYPTSVRIDGAGESISTAYHLRGENVEVVTVHVVGRTTGSVWGTDDYTDDSDIATAAVHAGLIKAGEEALVLLTPRAGRDSYVGSERNGVQSAAYGTWGGSYRLERLPGVESQEEALSDVLRGVTNLEEWRSKPGKRLRIEVTGEAGGSVYGTDLYTTDSSVASAAVHAGLVEVGKTAILTVEIVGEQTGFVPSTRNGVTSSQWQDWGGFRFVTDSSTRTAASQQLDVRVLKCETKSVTGRTTGPVWGSDVYTDDSDLGTAAVHAGRLKEGQTGELTIEYIEAPARHIGSDRNGIQTRDWNSSWQRSFRFVDPKPQFGQSPRKADGILFF